MKKINNILILLALLLVQSTAQAQHEVEMADGMRQSGKIYVVVAVILVIVFGLLAYLWLLDRKVSKMEKKLPRKDH